MTAFGYRARIVQGDCPAGAFGELIGHTLEAMKRLSSRCEGKLEVGIQQRIAYNMAVGIITCATRKGPAIPPSGRVEYSTCGDMYWWGPHPPGTVRYGWPHARIFWPWNPGMCGPTSCTILHELVHPPCPADWHWYSDVQAGKADACCGREVPHVQYVPAPTPPGTGGYGYALQ